MAKNTTKPKTKSKLSTKIGTSRLKSGSLHKKRNMIIAALVVLFAALAGGFFVYRSFASGAYVVRAVDDERRIFIFNYRYKQAVYDGGARVLEFGISNNGQYRIEAKDRLSHGAWVCFYYAMFDSNGNFRKRHDSSTFLGVGVAYQKSCRWGNAGQSPYIEDRGPASGKIRLLKIIIGDRWGNANPYSKDVYGIN